MRFRISIGGHTTSQNDPEMKKAVLALVHTRIPAILVANIVNSSLLLLVFIDTSARAALIIWYALIIITVTCFGALWFTYRDQNEADWSRRWGSTVFICHGVGGLLWGAAGVLFFIPQSVIHFTVLAFVLGGMAAGALATLSIHLPTFHAYVFPSLLPFCVRLAVEGGTANLAMAAMFLMYIVAIVAVAPQTRDAIAQTFALRFENRALLLGLEHRVCDRTRRHASVVDFSQRALSGLETDKLLQEAALIVAEGLPATCAAVMELLPGRDVLAVRSTAGWKGDVFTPAAVSAKSRTVSGHALLTGEPTVSHDPRADTRFEIPPELRGTDAYEKICLVGNWEDAFGNLQLETAGVAFTILQRPLDGLDDVCSSPLRQGQVHGGDDRKAAPTPLLALNAACLIVQSPKGMISPLASAIGINSPGRTIPRRGLRQRRSASTAATRPSRRSTCGW